MHFFEQLPQDFRYAVEVRNTGLLGPLYRDMLQAHGVARVYNHWSYMPFRSSISTWNGLPLPSWCYAYSHH